jgi:hypothetical protein
MTIVPSIRKIVVFDRPFSENIREEVCERMFERIHELEITALYDMKYNYSCEGGFELPKTQEWKDYLNKQDEHTRSIHTYQHSRQLRFYTDTTNTNIIGMRCKDYINLFTDYELDIICRMINEVIEDLFEKSRI